MLLSCALPKSEAYNRGYDDGCDYGIDAASLCETLDPGPETSGNPYAEGYEAGYCDCYEVWDDCSVPE